MSYVRHLVLVLVLFLILAFAGHFPQAQRAARGFRPEAVRSWLFPQRGLVPRRKICITRGALEVKIAPARPESLPFLGVCCGKKEAWSTKKEETAVIARSQVRACVKSQVVETLTTALFTQPRRDASVGKSALNKISNAPSSSRRVIPVSRGRWAICAPGKRGNYFLCLARRCGRQEYHPQCERWKCGGRAGHRRSGRRGPSRRTWQVPRRTDPLVQKCQGLGRQGETS